MSSEYLLAARALSPSLRSSPSSRSRSSTTTSLRSRTLSLSASASASASRGASKAATASLLAHEALRCRAALEEAMRRAGVRSGDVARDEALALVLVFELLLGRGEPRGGGGAKRELMRRAEALRRAWDAMPRDVKAEAEARRGAAREASGAPRFVRVNALVEPHGVEAVVAEIRKHVAAQEGEAVSSDDVVPGLVAVPASVAKRMGLHAGHELVTSGRVVLQDKSSCFPALALAQQMRRLGLQNVDAIDATAAPGNKTTQLAAYLHEMGGSGHVWAFDRAPDRFKTLEARVAEARASGNVTCRLRDFLGVDPAESELRNVRAILLDPSCSGSGLVKADLERAMEAEASNNKSAQEKAREDERVQRLAEFQLRALRHALSFPQAEVVSYSTCSVHVAENEDVVKAALESEEGSKWTLAEALPEWTKRRGVAVEGGLTSAQAAKLVRTDPTQGDAMNGIFVAVFVRAGRGGVGGGAAATAAPSMPKPPSPHVHAKPHSDPSSWRRQRRLSRRRELLVRSLVAWERAQLLVVGRALVRGER